MASCADKPRFTLQWHITHKCNLRCKHCYQDDFAAIESRENMESVLAQYIELLDDLGAQGQLNITGGEPLTHPDLFWLLSRAQEANIKTALLTNGTLIDRNCAIRLRAFGVDYVQISLDGSQKEHDAIRGSGSFEAALAGIRQLKAQGIFTSVSFTAQPGNLKSIGKLARICRDARVNRMWFDRVVTDPDEDGVQPLTPEQSRKLFCKAAKLSKKTPLRCVRALQFLECGSADVYRCSAGHDLLAVLANGDVMPCRRLPIVIGNVHDEKLRSIYRNSPVMQDLQEDRIPKACSACDHAEECRGGAKCIAYAQTKSYDNRDPGCMQSLL